MCFIVISSLAACWCVCGFLVRVRRCCSISNFVVLNVFLQNGRIFFFLHKQLLSNTTREIRSHLRNPPHLQQSYGPVYLQLNLHHCQRLPPTQKPQAREHARRNTFFATEMASDAK
ncbi:hypothetical protein TRVL_09960 [Trypanosoma vivax]|nr:hypothetical protein TRVL_09960 [Trypanosoma vivax]